MNQRLIILLAISIALVNCTLREGEQKTGLLSHLVNISDTEDAGVKDVLAGYGGLCEYSLGKSVATDEESKNYFELELSKTEFLDHFTDRPDLASSGVAYRFYRNLNKEEREKYTHINTVLVFNDGREYEMEFPTEKLELIDRKAPLIDKVVTIIKEKRFDDLIPLMDDSTVAKYDRHELVANLHNLDPQFGNVTENGLDLLGCKFDKFGEQGNTYVYIAGVVDRDVQPNNFSIIVDPNSNEDIIYYLQYKL